MAHGGGCVFQVQGTSGGWFWDGSGPLRRIPAQHGMIGFLNGIGWPTFLIDQTALNELVENFGQGDTFT